MERICTVWSSRKDSLKESRLFEEAVAATTPGSSSSINRWAGSLLPLSDELLLVVSSQSGTTRALLNNLAPAEGRAMLAKPDLDAGLGELLPLLMLVFSLR